MPNSAAAGRGRRGFTLLEVLVAFTIFAVSFAAILQIFSTGARNSRVSQAYAVALGHAQSQLDRLGVETPLTPGETSGELEDGMSWRLTVAPQGPPPDDLTLILPFEVTASVSWRQDGVEREITLTSLRLGSAL